MPWLKFCYFLIESDNIFFWISVESWEIVRNLRIFWYIERVRIGLFSVWCKYSS